jgi:predicted Zn-dependent protease
MTMKDRILIALGELRAYAIATHCQKKGCEVALFYHEEDSTLMRFANSAISLNTNEHLIRLEIAVYAGKKRASYELITDLNKLNEMKQGIDIAVEMVEHVQPLEYQPTIPVYQESFADESAYDPALAGMGSAEKLAYFNEASQGLETDELKLSGILSSGVNIVALTNTRSEHCLFFQTSDAQVSAVIAHSTLKWEVQSEQSAQKKSDLDPAAVQEELAFLVDLYNRAPALQLPIGSYDVVFGSAAVADLAGFMNWVGFNGGMMKRSYSFLKEEQVGQKVFSEKFTLVDDPSQRETFPFQRDYAGMKRRRYPIFENGVFKGFLWSQDDADEFGTQPTGHTVSHKSLMLQGGDVKAASLEELVRLPRTKDLLYIPFIHYMNVVNPSKGIVTGSSRFGALLLKKDGTIALPYNVRLTHSLLDLFGDKVAWMTQETVAYNTSSSYGARNPTAMIVPRFVCVQDLEISHSNTSF